MAGIICDDVEAIIEAVEKRPVLYLKSLKEYSDVNVKKNLWNEVCMDIVSEWGTLEVENKRKICEDIQKKRHNLRTCFARELKNQKTQSGQGSVKRRKYVYFEKLLFLKSSMEPCLTESNVGPNIDPASNEEDSVSIDRAEQLSRRDRRKKQPQVQGDKSTESFQAALLQVLKDDVDEDRNFALFLVTQLKSFTEDEKFEAKIGKMQLFRRIKSARTNIPAPYTTTAGSNHSFQPANSLQQSSSHHYAPSPSPTIIHSTPLNTLQQYVRVPSPSPASNHSVQSYLSHFDPTSPESDVSIIDL